MDRAQIVHEAFRRRVAEGDLPPPPDDPVTLAQSGLDAEGLIALYESQILSRHLDRAARELQARGAGYYTIGSSGHEGMAAVAAALRPTDMAFLHYRDAAFQIQRAKQVPGQDPMRDILLSFVTASDDPISGGRHKVLGSRPLAIPPQTSTIASHLPKAVGAAYAIPLAARLDAEHRHLEPDAVVLCSFGDASVNHSTAQGALNTAGWTAYRGAPLPLVLVCEDNGIGISVKTPEGWIEATISGRPGLRYLRCDGLDPLDTHRAARAAVDIARHERRPVFLHLRCVRLYGHAGADAQAAYLSPAEIEEAEANDPLLHGARVLTRETDLTAEDILARYDAIADRVAVAAAAAADSERLRTAREVMSTLIPPKRSCRPSNGPTPARRAAVFGEADGRAMEQPQPMAKLINIALTDLMLAHGEIVLAGEDVGRKGGVYGVTQKLQDRFGAARVIDTLLDEQSILGLAIGMAHNGLLPIPEIQFLAYLHNAEDQLRGEAATLSFFSRGQYTNPMVVRIAGLGYQRGFGGHFHNDNSLAVLRDIPGLVVACPSDGADAVLMLRECVRLAREEQRVVVFVEPIALYQTRDLHAPKDGGWARLYPAPGTAALPLGRIGVHGDGTDLALVSYGNGHLLSRQAAEVLRARHGIATRVVDLRWLAPLPEAALLEAVAPCDRVLVVDECRRTGSQSEALMTLFAERTSLGPAARRLTAEDSFIATGPAYAATLPSRDGIVAAALDLDTTRSNSIS